VTVRHRRILAVAAAAALLAVSASASAAAPIAPSTTTNPAAASAGWLAQQFVGAAGTSTPAGDHFNFPGTTFYWSGLTASAVFALAASKSGADKINAAISYMEQNAAADANLGKGTQPGPYDGSVATAALAAIVAGADPADFGGNNLLAALKADECTAVSAPADQNDVTTPTCPAIGAGNNIFSSVSESLIVLAEARAGGTFEPSTKAVDYFLSLQCSNGGFTIGTVGGTGCTSDVDATSYAIAALVALGGHQAALGKAGAWLLAQRNPAGYWSELPTPGANVDSTGLAASALDATGADTSRSRAWLASQQVTTGPTVGAGATRGGLKFAGAANAKATADGLLGMVVGVSLATLSATGATPGTALLALDSPKLVSASVVQGGKQTVTGFGFGAGEKVSAVLHSAPVSLSAVTATAAGTAVVTFTVPTTLTVGTHSVVLTGTTSGLTSTGTFIVSAAPVTPTPGTTTPAVPVPASSAVQALANSGLDGRQALIEALVGLACIVAGAGALYLGRRRRT
jgi:hypothetical protein